MLKMCFLMLLVSCGFGPGLSPTGAKVEVPSNRGFLEDEKEETSSPVSTVEASFQNIDDADGDGEVDGQDAFPNDPNEFHDSDYDGVGDNSDQFPHDPSESADSDGDGYGDNSDPYPNDSTKYFSRSLAVGGLHNCLLKADGTIWCWGDWWK